MESSFGPWSNRRWPRPLLAGGPLELALATTQPDATAHDEERESESRKQEEQNGCGLCRDVLQCRFLRDTSRALRGCEGSSPDDNAYQSASKSRSVGRGTQNGRKRRNRLGAVVLRNEGYAPPDYRLAG